MIGKLRARALAALEQRAAAGYQPPKHRLVRKATKSGKRLETRVRREERFFDFATCQRCGAFRVPENGKLPAHRCEAP